MSTLGSMLLLYLKSHDHLLIILMNTFQITYSLDQVYPDIQGELCSKHTLLLNKIQKAFAKAYPFLSPHRFLISKTLLRLFSTPKSTISMALEQGTIIAYSPGQEGSQIHISSNFMSEDLVLEGSGKYISEQGQAGEIGGQLRSMVEAATEDLSLHRINGGTLYIYCQGNPSADIAIKNSLLVALFMAVIDINNLTQEYTREELALRLSSTPCLKDHDVSRYFIDCQNRQFILSEPGSTIRLDQKYKFLILNLRFLDQNFNQGSFDEDEGQLADKFQRGEASISDLLGKMEERQREMGECVVSEFMSKLKEELKIKAFVYSGSNAVLLVQSYRYAELIAKIAKQLHQAASQIPDDGGLSKRFSSRINASEMIFSSVPSKALSILDASQL